MTKQNLGPVITSAEWTRMVDSCLTADAAAAAAESKSKLPFPLRNAIQLSHRASIILPREPDRAQEWIDIAMRALCDACGGCTVTQCEGGYKMADGRIVLESVAEVWAQCDAAGLAKAKVALATVAESAGLAMNQESVALAFDGVMFLIDTRVPASVTEVA